MLLQVQVDKNTDETEILLKNTAEKVEKKKKRTKGFKYRHLKEWTFSFLFCCPAFRSHRNITTFQVLTISLSPALGYLGYRALFGSMLFKFKVILSLLLFLAILLPLEIIRPKSGKIHC